MDRAHRLGQRRTVNVYRLLTRGTLEEKIMGLQQFKLDVAAAVGNQDNVSLSGMDISRLLDLFDVQVTTASTSTFACAAEDWSSILRSNKVCCASLSPRRLHDYNLDRTAVLKCCQCGAA